MSEYDRFMENNENKSEFTKKQYRIQYNKLFKLLEKPIAESSEKKILEVAEEQPNMNSQQALINIGILVRRMEKLSTKKLEDAREKNKKNITKATKEKNLELKETLPSYNDLIEYMDYLYDKSQWTDYIINYLLIHFQVRNQDLDFEIVKRKKDATDPEKNYMWLHPTKLTYIRNKYKTAFKDGKELYGKKINVITDKKMITAMRRVLGCQNYDLKCGVFIPNKNSIAYHLQKATYKMLGEGKYFKIIVNHFRNDLDKIKEISENRGTSVSTILSSYDIENV